jgi:hypothetical protein
VSELDRLYVELDLAEHQRDEAIAEAAKLRLVLREAFALDSRTTHQKMIDAANRVGLDLERLFLKRDDDRFPE